MTETLQFFSNQQMNVHVLKDDKHITDHQHYFYSIRIIFYLTKCLIYLYGKEDHASIQIEFKI